MMQFHLITFVTDKTVNVVPALQHINVSLFLWQWANIQCREWQTTPLP